MPEGIEGLIRAAFFLVDMHEEYNCEIGGKE